MEAVIEGATAGLAVSTVKDLRDDRALVSGGVDRLDGEGMGAVRERRSRGVGRGAGLKGPESKWQAKVEPASFEAKAKVGVESLMELPRLGPPVMLATGGVVSAVKPLKAL